MGVTITKAKPFKFHRSDDDEDDADVVAGSSVVILMQNVNGFLVVGKCESVKVCHYGGQRIL